MLELSKTAVADACQYRLSGHGVQSIQQTLLAVVNGVDPRLAKDVYGQGDVLRRFEEKVAACLGKEAGIFMPSGTMAQQIALRIWSDRSGRKSIGMHPTCHIYLDEQDAYSKLHGLDAVLVGDAERQMVSADLSVLERRSLAALVLELPQRHNGGTLPTWDELNAMRAWADDHQVRLHLDGARLWETRHFYQRPESEIAALFDSVYVSFYKGLGGIGGAMLLGSPDFIAEARVWQRRHGGNLYNLYPYVVAGEQGFDRYRPLMDSYVDRAKEIAALINRLSCIHVTPKMPPTNMMHLTFDLPQADVEAAALEVSADTGLWILGGLWSRPFERETPVFELAVGEATMKAGIDLVTRALIQFNDRLQAPRY